MVQQEFYNPSLEFTPVSKIDLEKAPRHIYWAIKFAIVILGWSLEYYYYYAVYSKGYETSALWGVQGSGKSNRMLQHLFWIYRFVHILDKNGVDIDYEYLPRGTPFLNDEKKIRYFTEICQEIINCRLTPSEETKIWRKVLDALIFKPNILVEKLEVVPDNEVLPGIGWDDVLVHYPSSMFKTDIKQYEAIDSTWAAIRTKASCIMDTLPNITRLAKNLKDNTTFEIYMGRNQMEMVKRIFLMPSLYDIGSNMFKITIEKPGIFNLFVIPQWVWDEYWVMRLKLTKEALKRLKGTVESEDLENYIPVLDVAEMLGISPNTVQQMESRGVIEGRKIQGILMIKREYVPRLKAIYGKGEATKARDGRV